MALALAEAGADILLVQVWNTPVQGIRHSQFFSRETP